MALTLNLGSLFVHLRASTIQYDIAMKKAVGTMIATSRKLALLGTRMVSSIASTFRRFGAFVGKWAKRIGIALLAIGAFSVKTFADFDDAMIKSLAIMGDVSEGMQQKMRDLARTLSVEGVTSATELAKSYFFLASAGLSAEQSMASLATVEAFAVAGAFDMAEATDLLTDAQSALGLTVSNAVQNMMNMTRVSDVLTGANTLANASTRQFALALVSQAGPAMKAFNVSLEQGVAVLAAYADQGIKAQRAGTMFSRMLRLMTKGFRDNQAAWKRFNVNIFDATGELLPMGDIINSLTEALGSMSTQQKGAALEMLGFMARSQQAILPLLGLGDRINEYNKQLKEMNGITKEVHEKQLKSFSSQMKILWNNVKDVAISIGERLAPELIKISDWFKVNREIIKLWSLIFAERIIFVKNVLVNFVQFIRSDWWNGLKLGFDVALELVKGFGNSIITIMKEAGRVAADEFSKAFGRKLVAFYLKLAKPQVGGLEAVSPAASLAKIGFMNQAKNLAEALTEAQNTPFVSTLKEDLKTITKQTVTAIENVTAAFEKLSGMDILSGPLEILRKNIEDIKSGPARKAIQDMIDLYTMILGGPPKIPGATEEEGNTLNSSIMDLSKLLTSKRGEGFEVARTSLVDPRSSGNTILDVNKQMLSESQKQTRILEDIEEHTLA